MTQQPNDPNGPLAKALAAMQPSTVPIPENLLREEYEENPTTMWGTEQPEVIPPWVSPHVATVTIPVRLPTTGRLATPETRPFLISKTNNQILTNVDRLTVNGGNVNVLVTGQHGTGKSELAQQFAATRNRPFAQLDCGGLTEAFQIFGKMTLDGDHTVYLPGLFTDAVRTPNCVIHLQELNRAESDRALNSLFSLLDDTSRRLWVEEMGEMVEVAPGVVFFATLNEGFQYIGTIPLDEALKNRFLIKLNLEPLPIDKESTLLMMKCGLDPSSTEALLDMVNDIRSQATTTEETFISTRDLIGMGTLMKAGCSVELALFTVMGTSVDNLESILLSQHLAGQSSSLIFDKDVELLTS